MNCRRINSLLSAYIDRELTGAEMLEVRQHLRDCPACDLEHETLQDTKRLLNSLAQKMARPEMEALLLLQASRSENPVRRWVPEWLTVWAENLRPLPVPRVSSAAGVALAAAGLVVVTLPLGGTGDEAAQRRAVSGASAAGFVPVNIAQFWPDGRQQQQHSALTVVGGSGGGGNVLFLASPSASASGFTSPTCLEGQIGNSGQCVVLSRRRIQITFANGNSQGAYLYGNAAQTPPSGNYTGSSALSATMRPSVSASVVPVFYGSPAYDDAQPMVISAAGR